MSGFARERGVAFLSIPELGRTLHPLNDVVALWKLWRLCRTARPHIVHTHTAKAGTLGRLAAWLAGVPVRVHTFHGHVFHGYFGRLKTLCFITLERALARITTQVVAISPRQAKDVARYLRLPAERVGVIPLGLDLDRFLTADADLERRRFGSDIVALTSDNEGTPVCLIEALACGRAVVATNVGGVADVLEEGRHGLLVPPRDEAALARALLTLADGSARERFGMTGRTSMRERY